MKIENVSLKDFFNPFDKTESVFPQRQNSKTQHPQGNDSVEISQEAKKALLNENESKGPKIKGLPGQELTEEERKEVERLKKIDAEVRRHEMAHKMAGGGLTGQIIYEYKTGPDGKRYAVAGHISIDTSPESTPEATLRKAAAIKRAALAPSNPSPADRKVAQKAQQMEAQARREIMEEQQEEMARKMKEMQEKQFQTQQQFNSSATNAANPLNTKPQKFVTAEKVKTAYAQNNMQEQKPKIKAATGPAVSRLDQDEEIQEESVPEVSPVE